MIVVAVKRVELLYRPDTTLHQDKPQTWVCFVSALGLLCISFGFAQGQVWVPPSRLKVDLEWTQKADLGFGLGLLPVRVCLVSTQGSKKHKGCGSSQRRNGVK